MVGQMIESWFAGEKKKIKKGTASHLFTFYMYLHVKRKKSCFAGKKEKKIGGDAS